MIKFDYSVNGKLITKLKISGHANFKNHGKDIVCAGVSSLAITITNEIMKIDKTINVEVNDNGLINIKNITEDSNVQLLCNTLVNGITSIAQQYPKNIKILIRNN